MKCSFPTCRMKLNIAAQICPCNYCGKSHCRHHRLPEDHECPNLEQGLKEKKEIKVKPKFVHYPRDGQVGT